MKASSCSPLDLQGDRILRRDTRRRVSRGFQCLSLGVALDARVANFKRTKGSSSEVLSKGRQSIRQRPPMLRRSLTWITSSSVRAELLSEDRH